MNNQGTDGAPPRAIHVEGKEKKSSWLPWLLLGLGLLALLYFLSQRDDRDRPVVAETTAAATPAPVATGTAPVADAAAAAGLSGLGSYLAGAGTLPRTFVFEQVEFATGSSDIRNADAAELRAVADTLKQYPNARVRLVGFADARGDAGDNARLGEARAQSVKAALVAAGIAANRIDTASGGETDPAATNATSEGRSENRRTELVALER